MIFTGGQRFTRWASSLLAELSMHRSQRRKTVGASPGILRHCRTVPASDTTMEAPTHLTPVGVVLAVRFETLTTPLIIAA